MSKCLFFAKRFAAKLFSFSSPYFSNLLLSVFAVLLVVSTAHGAGPLRVNATNSRYFFDSNAMPVYLAGTYLGHEQIELGTKDFITYLDFLQQQKHNFTRLWAWEQSPSSAKSPLLTLPYERTGPGLALDGGAKFDLRRLNQQYFDRLRARVMEASQRGVYVSVVLFQSLSSQSKTKQDNPWYTNPFHRDNNVNRIDGDTNGDGIGDESFTLTIPAITSLQEAYIRKVVDTLNDLDNVLYEISGDAPLGSSAWQSYIVSYLKSYQATKLNQHPVGIDSLSGTNIDGVLNSPADWIAFYGAGLNPPMAVGGKVLFLEVNPSLLTDSSSHESVWKSFTRGFNVIDKEPDSLRPGVSESLHAAITQSFAYSQIVNLSAMAPSDIVCSTGYCLAKPGSEYLVYLPSGGRVTVDLSASPQKFSVTWFDTTTGQTVAGNSVSGGGQVPLTSPFKGETLLHLLVQPQALSPTTTTSTTGTVSTSTTTANTSNTSTATNLSTSYSASSTTTNSKKTTVGTPAITPDGGAFAGSISVSLTDNTPGVTIYYTVDGSSPTQSSAKYSGPVTVSTDALLKAKAFKNNANPSSEASAWFSKTSGFDFALNNAGNLSVVAGASVSNTTSATLASGSTQAVSFSVSGLPSGATGSFSSASCSPSCSTVLNITTSGSTPAGNFSITVNATGGGLTRTAGFILTVAAPTVISTVSTPTITPNGGNFISSVPLTMATTTSGASIYYTIDGSSPTQSSNLYTGTINMTTTAVVKAKAFKSGYNPSPEASASFASDLVAYWKFDEGSGTIANDSSGNGNNGTLVNSPQWVRGIAGNALYFDGVDNNVTVLDSNSLDLSGSFTISAWVNPASLTDLRSVLRKDDNYYLYASSSNYCGNGIVLAAFGPGNFQQMSWVCDLTSLAVNTWTHLAWTYEGMVLTLYQNGIAIATSSAIASPPTSTGILMIGASQFGENFQGLIDEVHIYNRALGAAELLTLYQQNAPIGQPFDFALSSSGSISVATGASGSNTVSATLASGNTQAVSFSISGLPSGATASFSSATCTPTCSSLLTISTGATTPTGTYSITVSAIGGGVTRTTAFTLSVTASIVLTVATPTITPTGGTFSTSVSVALQSATSGSSIYYTTDGSTPTQSSLLYSAPMTLTNNASVNAKAFKSSYNPSAVASASFTNSVNSSAGSGTTYYIATNGSDSNNGTSTGTPFLTIQKCANIAKAGDTCSIRAGNYAGFSVSNSGSSGNYITFRNYPGDVVNINGKGVSCDSNICQINITGKQWITIQGLNMVGTFGSPLRDQGIGAYSSYNVQILNNTIGYTQGTGFIIALGGSSNFLVQGNVIHDTVMSNIEQSGQYRRGTCTSALLGYGCSWGAAFIAHYGTSNISVMDDVHYFNHGEGLTIAGSNNIVRRNIVADNWSAQIYCTACTNTIFDRNLVYISSGAQNYPVVNYSINKNNPGALSISDCDPTCGSMSDITVSNNILLGGLQRYAVKDGYPDSNGKVYGNTIISNPVTGGSLEWMNANTSISNLAIRNNIIVMLDDPAAIGAIKITPTASSSTISNNLYYRSSGARFTWGGTTYNSYANWAAASLDSHSMVTDPQLVDGSTSPCRLWVDPRGQLAAPCPTPNILSAGLNYKLSSSSPARDTGANISPDVTVDFFGVSRPQGSAYDIGSTEY